MGYLVSRKEAFLEAAEPGVLGLQGCAHLWMADSVKPAHWSLIYGHHYPKRGALIFLTASLVTETMCQPHFYGAVGFNLTRKCLPNSVKRNKIGDD